MNDYSSKSVIVVDNGLFAEFALRLARDFGKVYLYTPWQSTYPSSLRLQVGVGLPGVTKVEDYHSLIGKVDLWVFPDVCYGELQFYLASIGERVWGSRLGEELEQSRDMCKELLDSIGLPVGPWAKIEGMKALRSYIQGQSKPQYIKTNRTRGDFETFRADDYDLIMPKLDHLEHLLGARKEKQIFIVEEALDDAVELGWDGYTVDGRFPSSSMFGIEIKDQGYVGRFCSYAEVPEPLRVVNERFAPILQQYQYRNFWCAETRILRDGTPYVIDPCCRAGSPPSEVAQEMYTNLADIFWFGAHGDLVDPIPAAQWAAELMMLSDWASNNWQPIEVPEKYRDNVKLNFPTVIDEKLYVIPHMKEHTVIVGAIVATGETMKKAVNEVKRIGESIRSLGVDINTKAFDEAEEKISELAEYGYTF